MKSVILCLMTVLYIANAEQYDLKEIVQLIKQSREIVQKDIEQHNSFRVKIIQDADSYINKERNNRMQIFIYNSNRTLNQIRKSVEAATAEGKNAQPCFDTAFEALRKLKNIVTIDSDDCTKTAENSIKNELEIIDNLIATGEATIRQMDGIIASCLGSNDVELCATITLSHINEAVKKWESDAILAKDAVRSAYVKILMENYSNCLSNVFGLTSWKITEIGLDASECIEAL